VACVRRDDVWGLFLLAFLDMSQHLSRSLSRDGFLAGPPTHMSPEQARGEAGLDGRTDVYGLGATLYEVLTGIFILGSPWGRPWDQT
jgi:hypothetical protein